MPIRVSFITDDSALWTALDWTIDGIFMLDIIVTFFSAYFDAEENLVIQRRVINYITNIYV